MRALFVPAKVERFPEPFLGTVEQMITHNQPRRVKCFGTYWPAQFYQSDCQLTAVPEQLVNVVAIEGITLLGVPSNSIS